MPQPKGAKGKVTIIEIADAAGVSKSTVSLVLTGRGSVRPETRQHVLQTMRSLGYVYNRGAANLRNAQSRIVGLVLNDLSNPFFAEFAIGVEKVLQMAGYVAFMANTAESVVRQEQVMQMMREHGAGGVILCPALDTRAEHLDWAESAETALLVAIRRLPGVEASLVVPAMSAVLALSDRPTAVVCYNDVVAIGAMLAAARRGLVVGRDIAIVGFDDTSEARHVSPALTTIAIDPVGLGERAAAMLLDRITNPSAKPDVFVGSVDLIIRESCGAYHRALSAAG